MKRFGLRQTRPGTAIAVLALAAAASMTSGAVDLSGLLCFAPALALVAALLARRYPGERLLLRLARPARRPRRRTHAPTPMPQIRMDAVVVRGGLLLARSLAVRPPPAAFGAMS